MDATHHRLPEQPYLYVERDCSFEGAEIARAMSSAFTQIGAFVAAQEITPLAPPMTVYPSMGPERLYFHGALLVSGADALKASGTIKRGALPAGEAISTTHVGPYASLNLTHRALWKYMEDEGIPGAFPIWEIFMDDPATVPEAELRTQIFRAVGTAPAN